jgi:hypothetical protein
LLGVDKLALVGYIQGCITERKPMPKGPQGQKRPADIVGCAVMVAKLATGAITEKLQTPSGKVRSGEAGAKARAEKLSKEERTVIAKKAAAARWG